MQHRSRRLRDGPTPGWRIVGLGLAAFFAATLACVGTSARQASPGPLARVLQHPTLIRPAELGIQEASGVAYHEELDRLFVVGDNGGLAQLDREGRRMRVVLLKGDLEDIAVHPPTGLLLLVSERKARLIALDPRGLTEVRRWRLARAGLIGERAVDKRAGFEGLAFLADGQRARGSRMLLVHQRSPAMVLTLAFDPASQPDRPLGSEAVLSRWTFEARAELNGLTCVPSLRKYLLVDGGRRRLLAMGEDGRVVADWPISSRQPEGLCLDSRGTLWVADDREGLLLFPGALAALTEELTRR